MIQEEKATARMMKSGISGDLARQIAARGISSVMQLAAMTTAELRKLLSGMDTGDDTLVRIRKKAAAMKALVDNHLVTVRGQVSPVYKALASTNTINNIIDFHEGMESYPEMFGNLEYAGHPEFDSMISPAAYLVDLMRYIDEYIVQPQKKEDEALLLQSRRPDIWNIPLDMENTIDEVPYLELVNEILRTKLDADGKIEPDGSTDDNDKIADALQYMAETIFPFNLPFNTPLEEIRKYLEALHTTLYDIYHTFDIDSKAETREYLRLSPEQAGYLITPLVNKDSLNLAYGNIDTDNPNPHFTGIEDDANLGSLTLAEVFMNQVGFTQAGQLEALCYQNIDRKLHGSNELLNGLFINKRSRGHHLIVGAPEPLGNAEIWLENDLQYAPPDMAVLDRLNRFIRLARLLEWSYEDLDWALIGTAADDITENSLLAIKDLQWIRDNLHVTVSQTTSFWHDIKTYGEGNGPLSRAPFDIIFNQPMPFFRGGAYHPRYQPNPNYQDEPLIWQTDGKSAESQAIIFRLMAAFNLDAGNLQGLVTQMKRLGLSGASNEIELTVEYLSVLYRYSLLANSLKLSIPQLIVLLELLDLGDRIFFSSDEVIRIVTCNRSLVENKLNVYQLNYICRSIASKFVQPGFDLLQVPAFLKSLSEAATEWYLNAGQLTFENLMTAPIGLGFYNTLVYRNYIDDRGIALVNEFSFAEVADCFICEEIPYATSDRLRSVCKVGNTPNGTASQVLLPFSPNAGTPVWNGSVTFWFKYDGTGTGACTLYHLYLTGNSQNATRVQLTAGKIVLQTQDQPPVNIYSIAAGSQWHFLVVSYKEQLISLDNLPPVTGLTGLQIPTVGACAIALGEGTNTFQTSMAELRLFEGTAGSAESNYWPLSEGQGSEKAKDVAGDLNGTYAGKNVWSIRYNSVIPVGFKYLNANGSLTTAFDPANIGQDSLSFVGLWKTIVNLRNILNSATGIQKQGTLQLLSGYYHLDKDLAIYADYTAEKDGFPSYVQTLLAYRFSLNWPEFSLALDRATPFVSPYLIDQFSANNIGITEMAGVTRMTDTDDNPVGKWLITQSADEVYFLDRRQDALDIYKLLPAAGTETLPVDDAFPSGERYGPYGKFHLHAAPVPEKPALYFSDHDDRIAVMQKKGNYVRIGTYALPGSHDDIVSRMNSFIADLGRLLFAVKTLQLSDAEFACIVENKQRLFATSDETSSGVFSLPRVKEILSFKKLNNTYVAEDMSFTDYFYMADDMGSLVNYIARLTRWDTQGVRQLSQWNCRYRLFASLDVPGNFNPLGRSVGANANYAILGYPSSNHVLVYQLAGAGSQPLPRIIPPQDASAFGSTVLIQDIPGEQADRLRAVIADTSVNNGQGSVYVYQYNGVKKEWDQPAQLTATDGGPGDAFGSSISIYGNTMAVGAPNAGSGTTRTGNVYLFENIAGTWTSQAVHFDISTGDNAFGSSISLYDHIIVIGSAKNAYVFRIDRSTAAPVISPFTCNRAKVATNGDVVVMSAMSGSGPAVHYLTGIDSATPSAVNVLENTAFSGICTVALEEDTLLINDSTNTCFVYYAQDALSYRHAFKATTPPASPGQPWPIVLGDGYLIIASNEIDGPTLLYGPRHDIGWFGFADECFRLAGQLGVRMESLLDFASLSRLQMDVRCAPGNSDQSSEHNKETYRSYENYANKLANALTVGLTGTAWNSIFAPLRDKFLERQRDALAGYMIYSLRNRFTDIANVDDLYELLLIDVGSSGCRTISKIKAALNSLQLYIERCRMQLEPFASITGSSGNNGFGLNTAEVEWSWMSHYRIWEANREVYLFPEKYFNPALRKDKTAAYADLQNRLSQSDLTGDQATEAFQSYFNDLEVLAGLTVVATCTCRIDTFVNGITLTKYVACIFAKTKNRNEGYYYRTAEVIAPDDAPPGWINWTNWQKINVSINADSVTCIYAGGRPFLFWLEFTKQQVTGDGNTYSDKKTFTYGTRAYYSYRNASGQWANPHEVPDPRHGLDFTVTPTGSSPAKVVLPEKPEIIFLYSFLDIANITFQPDVTNGAPSSITPVPIDTIINMRPQFMWTFDRTTADVRGNFSLGEVNSTDYLNGHGVFADRSVLFIGGNPYFDLLFPYYFNTWFNSSFTLGIWINGYFIDTAVPSWPIVWPYTLGAPKQFCFQVANGYPSFGIGSHVLTSKTQLQNETWYFIVFTYDTRTEVQSIFINGILDNRASNKYDLIGNEVYFLGVNKMARAYGRIADMFTLHSVLPESEVLSIYEHYTQSENNPDLIPEPDNITPLNSIQTACSEIIQQFSEDLFIGGADYMYGKNAASIGYSDLSANAPYGKYMWEIFYHIPMLTAQLLSGNKKFEDAKHWYEYIFNPTAADKSNDRFWQLGYFRSLGKPEDLIEILTGHSPEEDEELLIYDLDPFDPEAIAYLRPGAFEKKTVINYIANLLDWGDSLFSEYTWESITQAEMLYILAKEILGNKPDLIHPFTKRTPMTIDGIEQEYGKDIPQFVIDIEDMQPMIHPGAQFTLQLSASLSNFYFGIPEDDQLSTYRDLMATRLYEIRHCLNILGRQQTLALFEPPIDAAMLIAAAAAGLDRAEVAISSAAAIPHFRFTKMIEYAKTVCGTVMDFGHQILAALEKKDEESLNMLRTVQEKNILALTTSIKERAVQEAVNQGLVLDQSLASANERVGYYTAMLAKPVSDLEGKALAFNQEAISAEMPAIALRTAAVAGHLIPTVFGFADGDFSPGGSIEAAATALSTWSGISNNLATMTAVSASYSRRAEDWDLQLKLAQYEVNSIGTQKAINDIQIQNARSELAVQRQSIADNQSLQDFYANKFTNSQLYQWTIDQVSSVYYQAFQLAQDIAKKAQAAYQFELNTNEGIISYGYWDNRHRGLLAGEKLISDLGRLEKAYIDNCQRCLEIQKIVSVKEISISEFGKLISTGTCRISLTEQLYDWDFPGHYNRKIKSVSITIPAIVGPYQSIKASLVQQSNKVVTQPDLDTVRYLVSKDKAQPPANNSLRLNWRPNQQIAISRASGDSGMFELNFNDDRYLPFEGTGAISEWQLNIPMSTNAFDINTIADVIMYINYTAQDGGVEFGQQVIHLPEIRNFKGILVMGIKQQFNQAWNTFISVGIAVFSVKGLQFPANLQLPVVIDETHIVMACRTIHGNDSGIVVKLTCNKPFADDWEISCDDPKRMELLDIILEIPYSADLR